MGIAERLNVRKRVNCEKDRKKEREKKERKKRERERNGYTYVIRQSETRKDG